MLINWFKEIFNPIKRITKEEEIRAALKLVTDDVIDRLSEQSVTIKWYDLDSYSGTNVFACRAKSTFGDNFILLNIRYKQTPIEQLACLITHESCHVKEKADLKEEVTATYAEAKAWKRLRKQDYEHTPLYDRLEKLAGMTKAEITAHIKESNFYEKVLVV